jgi:chorismate mutase
MAIDPTTPPPAAPDDPVLAGFRKSIDNIDAALIHMLAERFRITKAVGEHKAKTALPAADPGREQRQVARLRKLAEDADLDPEFSEKFLRFIIDEVIRHHEQARLG